MNDVLGGGAAASADRCRVHIFCLLFSLRWVFRFLLFSIHTVVLAFYLLPLSVKRNYTTERDWEKCSDNFQFLLTRLNFIVQRARVCVCGFLWLWWIFGFNDFMKRSLILLRAFASYRSYMRIALKIHMNFRKHFAETVNFISFPFAMTHSPTEVYYAQKILSFNFLLHFFFFISIL